MDVNQFFNNLQYWQNISQFLLNYNQPEPSNYNHIISINQMSQILTADLPELNSIFTPEQEPLSQPQLQLQQQPQPQLQLQPQPQPQPKPQPQLQPEPQLQLEPPQIQPQPQPEPQLETQPQVLQNPSCLWMGGVALYMDKKFILEAFHKMGEYPISINVVFDKYRRRSVGYAFIEFNDPTSIIQKLDGLIIPNSDPPIKFNLNHGIKRGKYNMNGEAHHLWVGGLSEDVNNNLFFETFACRYNTIKKTRVVYNKDGTANLGYGFICFGSEEEQLHCLENMNNFKGLGKNRILIKNVIRRHYFSGKMKTKAESAAKF